MVIFCSLQIFAGHLKSCLFNWLWLWLFYDFLRHRLQFWKQKPQSFLEVVGDGWIPKVRRARRRSRRGEQCRGQQEGELAAFWTFGLLSGGCPGNQRSLQQDVLKRYWAHNPQLLHKCWSTAGSHQLLQSRSSSNRCHQYKNMLALLSLGFCRGRHRLVPHITLIFDSLWDLSGEGLPSLLILSMDSNSRIGFLNIWDHIA